MIGGKVAERLNGSRPVTAHPESDRASHRADRPAETGQTLNATTDVASAVQPLLKQFFPGVAPVRFTFWDGSATGADSTLGRVVVHSPAALTRMMWSPNELGMARAFVAGDVDIDGDLYGVLNALHSNATATTRTSPRAVTSAVSAALRLGAMGPPPKRPAEEVHLSGWRHSKERDAAAIRHHYDVGDDFYRLVLGPAMTYSCARFEAGETSLERAQWSKHDLICRKLGLADGPDKRLLDVGCGWGSMAIHATREYRAKVVAITLSASQEKSARQYTQEAGVAGQVDVRLQDYRDLRGESFDAISSIGMFEHVGRGRMSE
jgi:cyclopropane-fatty-acyl-phospholipid synthase